MTGWVYFAHLAGHSPIKIGHAFDVHSRLRALSVGSPFKLVMLGAYLSANAKADEKRLKTKLAAHRIKGEWFQAEPVLAEMKTLAIVTPELIFKIDSPHDSRKSRFEFRVTCDEARAWKAAANKENLSLSEWIRLCGNAGVELLLSYEARLAAGQTLDIDAPPVEPSPYPGGNEPDFQTLFVEAMAAATRTARESKP